MLRRASSAHQLTVKSPAEKNPPLSPADVARRSFVWTLSQLQQDADFLSSRELKQRLSELAPRAQDLLQVGCLFELAATTLGGRGRVPADLLKSLLVRLVPLMDLPAASVEAIAAKQHRAESAVERMAPQLSMCTETEQLDVINACISACQALDRADDKRNALAVFTSALWADKDVSIAAYKALCEAKRAI